MKAMKIVVLGLVAVLLVVCIVIGISLLIPAPKTAAPQTVEKTIIETPFGSVKVIQNENDDRQVVSSDGRFNIRLGSYVFNLGFGLNKDEPEQVEPETEKTFSGAISEWAERVRQSLHEAFAPTTINP